MANGDDALLMVYKNWGIDDGYLLYLLKIDVYEVMKTLTEMMYCWMLTEMMYLLTVDRYEVLLKVSKNWGIDGNDVFVEGWRI
jgi:hypothetical protein